MLREIMQTDMPQRSFRTTITEHHVKGYLSVIIGIPIPTSGRTKHIGQHGELHALLFVYILDKLSENL